MRLFLLIIPFLPCAALAATPTPKTKTPVPSTMEYVVDAPHSKVAFEVEHLKFSTVEGKFTDFEGSGTFNPGDFTKTVVQGSVKASSVSTDNERRDNHLKGPDFFDAKKFPTMTFKSKKAEKTGDTTFKLVGDLTIKGITKEVTFDCKYVGETGVGGTQRVAVKGTTTIDRTHFNVNFDQAVDSVPIAGKEVTIIVSLEAISKKDAQVGAK